MTIQEVKDQIKTLETKAYNLKTKKAEERARVQVNELRGQAFDLLCQVRDRYATFSIKGIVKHWSSGGEYVFIKLSDGEAVFLSPTVDVVAKSWYPSTCCVEYTDDQEVVVEFTTDIDMERLSLVLVPRAIHGGTLNQAKYAELCQRHDLAFFKYPEGMSGLFA
jgi:hypothetical protein